MLVSTGHSGSTTIELELGALGSDSTAAGVSGSLLVRPPATHGQQLYQNPYQPAASRHISDMSAMTTTSHVALEPAHSQMTRMPNERYATGTQAAYDSLASASSATAAAAASSRHLEAQMLPGHLKFGMYASLLLTTAFVAGAKLLLRTLDQPGTSRAESPAESVLTNANCVLFALQDSRAPDWRR